MLRLVSVGVEIRPVLTQGEVGAFIELPFVLYAGEPRWIPPLRLERRAFLSRRFNAFFGEGEARLFLAWRGERVVGRISAHVDHPFNDFHGRRWGMFGFLELEDDPEVLDALLGAAEEWLRARGCDRMVGPMSFTMNDECGVLLEGFEHPPVIRTPWQAPYLHRLCNDALEKAMDLLMWEIRLDDRNETLAVIEQLANDAESKHGVRLRRMSRRTLRPDLDRFAEVYNAAWSANWDFRPYTAQDLDHLAQEMQLVFQRDWFMIAEKDGETAAAGISIPDINQVLARMGGRILPTGWWHFLRKRRIINRVRIGFLGVKPEFQHTGIAAKLYIEHFETSKRLGGITGEAGWILETNLGLNRAMEALHGRVIKRFRMYERRFSNDTAPAFPKDARTWSPSSAADTPAS